MFWSAASLVLTVAFTDVNDLTERELRAWKKVQPSIVYLLDGQRVRGSAALISKDGLFLTHATSVVGKAIQGRKSDGSLVQLIWVASDEPTQFVLLKAEDWDGDAQAVTVSLSKSVPEGLLAITPTGPIRAERAKDAYGIVNPSRRMMAISEVFLENNLPTMGGSLLVNMDGQLTGALNAALQLSTSQNIQKSRVDNGNRGTGGFGGPGGPGGGNLTSPKSAVANGQYGPGILGSAYTIGPKMLNRVVSGFLSSDHTVKHPAIGILCRDALPSGALVDTITKDSPAQKAGLVKGDVINSINNEAVRDQMDFARIMADQDVGETLKIWITRNGFRQLISVEVGV